MTQKAFQDHYQAPHSICYGCGRLNPDGLHIKSYWDGDETVCRFTPRPYHTAMAGYVYGGLIASVIDCHGTGTAAAAAYRAQGREMGTEPDLRFVTASLRIDYLHPTPIDAPMELRGRIKEIQGRKVIVSIELTSKGQTCAKGEVVAVQIPEHLR
jgi:acyl-CoA thioesterase FadM